MTVLWTAGFLNERFPAPVSPLGWSVLGPLIEEIALRDPLRWMGYREADTIPVTRLYRGHPYANVAIFQILYKPFPDSFLPDDAVRYYPDGATNFRKLTPYPRGLLDFHFLRSVIVHFFRDPLTASPLNSYAWSRYIPRHDGAVRELDARLAVASDPRELFDLLDRADDLHRALLRIHRWSLTYADLFFGLLKRATGAERAERLVAHTPNKTVEIDNALRELARLLPNRERARPLDALPAAPEDQEFVRAFDEFLAVHGHRSFSLDIAQPTFAETPDSVLEMIRTLTPLPPRGKQGKGEGLLVSLARRYVALREDQRYYWQKSLAVTRHAFLKLADLLAARGIVKARQDIFYARRLEIRDHFRGVLSGEELGKIIAARKEEWQVYADESLRSSAGSYPAFLRGDELLVAARPTAQEWRGRGVSPGRVRGSVRIARHHDELVHIREGEILVAPSSDPAWTPVFARLRGLVLERGGVLSHGAVVAREYGLPAVVGLTGITDELREGEMIEVDGSAGIVRRIPPRTSN